MLLKLTKKKELQGQKKSVGFSGSTTQLMRITDQLFKDDEPTKTRPMGSQILIYLAGNSHKGATNTFALPAWSQLGVLKNGGIH